MRRPPRLRVQAFGAVFALAIVALLGGGGAASAGGGASEAPGPSTRPAEHRVLDRTRHGRDALARLESTGELARVAAKVGWSPAQLRETLTSDETLNVQPDGQLLYVESASSTTRIDSQPAEVPAASASYADAETFTLHSLPGSDRVVYLDFVGMASGVDITNINATRDYPPFDLDGSVLCPVGTADPACFTPAELADIRDIWARVAEHYSAFDVDITTEDPGLDALHRLECVRVYNQDLEFTEVCPPGISPGYIDAQYGARVVFGNAQECGAVGCAYLSEFDRQQVLQLRDPVALVEVPPLSSYNRPRNLATVADHEIGHLVGLQHDTPPNGRPEVVPAGPVVTPLMRGMFASDGTGAPRMHFTPYPCPLTEDGFSTWCTRHYRDSYGYMNGEGLTTRADEPSPVAEPQPSFVAHGVIALPPLTGPRFYNPAQVNFDYRFSTTTADSDPGAGVLRLDSATQSNATVLRIDEADLNATNVVPTIDAADDFIDDDVPMKTFLKVSAASDPNRYAVFHVNAIETRPGYRNVHATVIDYSNVTLFNDNEAVVVSYQGTGASVPADEDAYVFTVPAGATSTAITVVPAVHSNLDVATTLYDNAMTAVATSDPPSVRVDDDGATGLDASITATLAPGEYTLVVRGAGLAGSYTNYGSIGTYTVTALTTFPMGVAVGGGSVVEGDTGKPRTVTFPVVLPSPATSTVTVNYSIEADGSARAATGCTTAASCASGGDFRAKTGTVTFKPSLTTGFTPTIKYVNALVYPDTTDTSDETFRVVLSNPVGVALGRASAVGTILNDDGGPTPSVSIGDEAVPEGNTAVTVTTANNGKVWVTLSEPATTTMSVDVTLTPTGATAGADFKFGSINTVFPATKTITFAAGQWQKPVAIGVFPDTAIEGDETVTLTLTNPSAGLALGGSTGTLTILDNDFA